MSPSLVLFDLDETLFDHRHASRSALRALKRDYPSLHPVSLEELAHEAARILEHTHRRVLAGELSKTAARVARLRELFLTFGVYLDEAGYDAAVASYVREYRRSRRPVNGARRLLEVLGKEQTIGIVTNNFREEQESKLADCGLTDLIDFMVTSQETGSPKPEAAIFREALDRGDAMPSEAVMVGDDWHVDVLGARRCGIRPVWFNRHFGPAPEDVAVDQIGSFEPLDEALRVILRSR